VPEEFPAQPTFTMNFKILPKALLLLLGGCALLMGVWVRMAWPAIGALAVFHACIFVI